jgi:hypothetical protein
MKSMTINILKLSYLSDKKVILIPILLFILAVIFLSVFIISTPTNGDTYAYAYSVQHLQGSRIHPGYYFLGHFIYLLTRFLSLSPLFTLGIFSILAGGLAVSLAFLLVYKLSRDFILGLVTSIVLLFSGGFWFYSVHGEVYVPQLAFVLLSLLFTYYQKPIISSLLLLMAISITPTSVLVLPALFFIMYRNKSDKKQFSYFLIPLIIPVLVVFVLKFSKIGDIIELAVYSPRIFLQNFSLVSLFKKILLDLFYVYGKSFGLLNFVAIFGLLSLHRDNRNLFWIMFLLVIPFTLYIFNLGLLTEDHLIITFVPMSLFIAYGLSKLFFIFKKRRVIVTVAILILLFSQSWLSYQIYVSPERRRSAILESTFGEFSKKYEPRAILISDWNFGMPFWYLTKKETNYSLLTGRPVKYFRNDCMEKEQCLQRLTQSFWIDIPNLPIFLADRELKNFAFQNNRNIYFVDNKNQPNRLKEILQREEAISNHAKIEKRIIRFVNFMEKNMGSNLQIVDSLDFPMNRIYKLSLLSDNSK